MLYISTAFILVAVAPNILALKTNNNLRYMKRLLRGGNMSLQADPRLPILRSKRLDRRNIPKTFDVRNKWPYCKELFNYIHDQGECGGCWAFAAVSLMSHRHCIETKGEVKFYYSAQDVIECTYQSPRRLDGCFGGKPADALRRWISRGIVSGKHYKSQEGCKPFSENAFLKGYTSGCHKKCSNGYHNRLYEDDLKFGARVYRIPRSTSEIQHEIMTYGPVLAVWIVYRDFLNYMGGVYRWNGVNNFIAGHSVMILGWGTENGYPYWLCVNTWGPTWGPNKNGLFKFLRGRNQCLMEQMVHGATTKQSVHPREELVYPNMTKKTSSSGNFLRTYLGLIMWLFIVTT